LTEIPKPNGRRNWMGLSGKDLADFGRLSGLGLTFAASVAVFGGGGYFLDQGLGTYPWFLSIGVFVGGAGGILHIVRQVK
jgi:F0F1-type ATP synthase assembly protein I